MTPVASQVRKTTFFGCPARRGRHRVRDEVERVGAAGVLGELLVVEVEEPRDRIVDDVLEDRAEPARGREDLRLRLGGEADHLGVAAVLEVEDAVVAPPVLVVADEAARGVGRERRLPGAGEAEEDRGVAVLAHVRRAVHRENAVERQQVVEDREDGLLDLAGIAGAADDRELLTEVEDDERLGPRPVGHRVRLEARRRDDREVGDVPARLLDRPVLEEHRPGEEAVPRLLRDDADGETVIGVGPAPDVLHEDVAALQVARRAARGAR